jgi:hypothetical protein
MTKQNKAALVTSMLERGYPVKTIKRLAKTSESYIYLVKKKLAEAAGEVVTAVKEAVNEAINEEVIKAETKKEELDTVLDEREDQYGSFMQAADTAIKIKGVMHNAIARNDLHLYPDQLLSLDMIAVKISRIVNGNPAHRDSWIDIAGYATLVAERLQGKAR